MYISKITITHMRCYKEVVIDLNKEGIPSSLMLAGNNGSGKSAILRSIAMGLCDQISAGSLLRELLGDFVRKEKDKRERTATITVNLINSDDNNEYQIKTEVSTNSSLGFEWVKQELSSLNPKKTVQLEEFPWNKIFVTAYGAGLRTEGTEDYGQFFSADAVYSLFKYSHPMQNPELIWRRLIDVARDSTDSKDTLEQNVRDKIRNILLKVLNLSEHSSDNNKDDVFLENNGIFIKSGWGKQELSALGDGYRGLTTMIMDILSWQLLMKNNEIILKELETNKAEKWIPLDFEDDCTGIVIIDEIEKHLHPRLQRLVIKKLKDVFPNIQFIISSHSPLCVAGTADIKNEYMIYRTLSENGNNVVERWKGGLAGLRTDQILEHFFQVPYINEGTLSDMETYSELYLMGEAGRKGQEETFVELAKRLSKSSKSTFLELENKLLDEIIRKQSEKVEKMIKSDND